MNTKAYYELALANSLGRTDAAVLERIRFWIGYSKLEHDGKIFCFRTLKQLAAELAVSVRTVQRSIARLVALGYLIVEKLKASKWNQVNCYALGERFEVTGDTSGWRDQAGQNDSVDDDEMAASSVADKKSSLNKKIKRACAKARAAAKGFGNAFKEKVLAGTCKACKGTGIVSDENNCGYRCLCADGRSKSAQIPAVPEQLFLSLRNQIA